MTTTAPVASALCHLCGRIVTVTPVRPVRDGAPPPLFYTLDDHEGADGRCRAVGDLVERGRARGRR